MADEQKTKKLTGLRKREQIAKANKTVFLWVAGAAVVLSFGVSVGQVLIRQAMFNQKVISAKSKTATTLSKNIDASKTLKENVNALLANQDLLKARADSNDNAWKVVLDALPTASEPLAFGSSLQLVLLPGTGASLENLTVGGDATTATAGDAAAAAPAGDAPASGGQIPFTFTVTGNISQIKNVFSAMERSIRPITVTSSTIEGTDASLKLTVVGYTSYQDAKTVKLQKETIQP